MKIYCIYNNPSDHPNKYVVRIWDGNKPRPVPEKICDDLGQAREAIPDGCYLVKNFVDDDPCIEECWL